MEFFEIHVLYIHKLAVTILTGDYTTVYVQQITNRHNLTSPLAIYETRLHAGEDNEQVGPLSQTRQMAFTPLSLSLTINISASVSQVTCQARIRSMLLLDS